ALNVVIGFADLDQVRSAPISGDRQSVDQHLTSPRTLLPESRFARLHRSHLSRVEAAIARRLGLVERRAIAARDPNEVICDLRRQVLVYLAYNIVGAAGIDLS